MLLGIKIQKDLLFPKMLEVGQENMSDYGYLGQCENSVLKESISHNSFSNFRYAFNFY